MYCIHEAACDGSVMLKEAPISSSPPASLVVHSTWNESNNEAFPQVLEYRHKWEALGFEISLTPDEAIRNDILALHMLEPSLDLLNLFDNLATNVMRYDVWRYTKLYLDGGLYADVDIEPLMGGGIADYVKQSQLSGLPVFFEESNLPSNIFTRFIIPQVSDYMYFPSYGNSVMIAPGPQNAFFLDLLRSMHPEKWRLTAEPKRTLMSTGPGLVTQFIKHQPSTVVIVGYLDRKQAYIHHMFGTWKSWMPREYWVAYYFTMAMSMMLVGMLLFSRCHKPQAMVLVMTKFQWEDRGHVPKYWIRRWKPLKEDGLWHSRKRGRT
jgi:Glycosyltransferase sugar-binding region containing DXD motif